MHSCNRFEEAWQATVERHPTLRIDRVQKRAPRRLAITELGMNETDDTKRAGELDTRAMLTKSRRSRLGMAQRAGRIACGAEHLRVDSGRSGSAVRIVQRAEHPQTLGALRATLVDPLLVQVEVAEHVQVCP